MGESSPMVTRETRRRRRKLAQEVIARRLCGAMLPSSSIPSCVKAWRSRLPRGRVLDRIATAGDTLRSGGRSGAGALHRGRPRRSAAALLDASSAGLGRGELQEATQLMRRAISVAPERPDLRADYERLSRQLGEARGHAEFRPSRGQTGQVGRGCRWPGARFVRKAPGLPGAPPRGRRAAQSRRGPTGCAEVRAAGRLPGTERRRRPCAPSPDLPDVGAQIECQA